MLTDAVRDLKCGQGGVVVKKANTFADVMYRRRSLEGGRYSVSLTVPNGMLHSGGNKPQVDLHTIFSQLAMRSCDGWLTRLGTKWL